MPTCFINIVTLSLTGHTTQLRLNGTMQGDLSLMLYCSFYNVPLVEIALSSNELLPSFVDDSMMLAIGNTAVSHKTKGHDGASWWGVQLVLHT